jgi:hypothetical protein
MAAALSWFASFLDFAGWTPGSAGSVPSRFSGYGAGLASSTPSYQPFRHTRIVRYNIEAAEVVRRDQRVPCLEDQEWICNQFSR